MSRRFHWLLIAIVAAVAGACSSSSPVAAVVGVADVTVTPGTDTMFLGTTILLDPLATDIDGHPLDATFEYTSSSAAIATVDSHGMVTAVATGTTRILVSTHGIDKYVTIVIVAAGHLTGRVFNALTLAPVAGATVTFTGYFSNDMVGSATTGADGTFTSGNISAVGNLIVAVAASGYITGAVTEVNVAGGASMQLEPIPLVPTISGTSTISGNVRDATTGDGVGNVVVYLRHGFNEAWPGVTTNAFGEFQFTAIAAGTYTLETEGKQGYYNGGARNTIAVGGGTAVAHQDLVLSPLGSTSVRVVLTWGVKPSDLDAHLTGPSTGGARFHVYFASRGSTASDPYAGLDVDNTHSYGPETITISELSSGTYRFSVHDYTNRDSSYTTALATSAARVDVYYYIAGIQHQQTFYPPDISGTLWTVFEMSGNSTTQQVTAVNSITYVSGSSGVTLRSRDGPALVTDADAIAAAQQGPAKPTGH